MHKYDKWRRRLEDYGGWVIILLRTFPLMPNNIVSFMASLSPIRFQTYAWATLVGTMLHLWLLALHGLPVISPEAPAEWWWFTYVSFCAILLLLFNLQVKRKRRADSDETSAHNPGENP